MPEYCLRLSVPNNVVHRLANRTFFWTKDDLCSFDTSIGPRLLELGPVPQPNIEFVRVAVGVYGADRTAARGSTWSQRQISVVIPTWRPERWLAVQAELSELLGFLSGDSWDLQFVRANTPRDDTPRARPPHVNRVVLFSGGADSLCGALVSRNELNDDPQALVSHYSWRHISPIQRMLSDAIERTIVGGQQYHQQIRLSRRTVQPVTGRAFNDESSTRTRSLLFIALGLAVASINQVPLWMPENGFASLNPPLSPERRGSLSTRTTHPLFLEKLTNLLRRVGIHGDVINPFARLTKGEVFGSVRDLLGQETASRLLSQSHSCGHTNARWYRFPAAEHCGVCFGCLVRRAAFAASGLTDSTRYIANRPHSPDQERFLNSASAISSVRFFVSKGIAVSDIAALNLPSTYPGQDALDLCQRALAELSFI